MVTLDLDRFFFHRAASPANLFQSLRKFLQVILGQLQATDHGDCLAATAFAIAERLHQEAALIATRADIEEEVKRLTAHIAALAIHAAWLADINSDDQPRRV